MAQVRSQRFKNSRLPASSKYDTFFLLQSLSSCRDVAGTGCLWRERKTVHPSSTCEPKRSPVRPFSSRISSASRPAPSASATNTPHEITITRSEEHTSEPPVTNAHLVCRLLLEKKKKKT